MIPEQTMDQGCKGVRRAMKASTDAQTKEIGILTAAARNLVEGEGSGESEALGEPAVDGDEEMSLSLGVVNEIARRGATCSAGRMCRWASDCWPRSLRRTQSPGIVDVVAYF